MKKVSIIVPVYHVSQYLRKSVESVLNQSYTDIELILVDDGGDDECPNICEEYCLRDVRVKCIHKQNEGQSMARKAGLSIATGDYIMYLDADDWLDENTVERCVAVALEKEAEIVCFGYKRVYSQNVFETPLFEEDREFSGSEIQKLHRRMIGLVGSELANVEAADRLVTMWGKLYDRKSALDGLWISERIIGSLEDAVYNLGAFEKCEKCIYIHQFFYNYRKTDGNTTTGQYREKLVTQWETLYDIFEEYILKKRLGQEYIIALNNRIALGMLGIGLNELSSPDNFLKKAKKLKNILGRTRWNEAYQQLEFKYFPIHWKAFYYSCKTKLTGIMLVMLVMIRFLKSRVAG